MKNTVTLFTKNFLVIIFANLLLVISFQFLNVTLPFFITYLGGNEALAGLLSGLFAISAVLFRPIAGWFLDNKGRRVILFVGLILMLLVPVLHFLFPFLTMCIAIRLLNGLAWAFSTTATNTNASDIIPTERLGEGMGYFGLTSTLALAIGPAIGLALMNNLGFNTLFITTAALVCVVIILMLFFQYKKLPPREEKASLIQNLKGLICKEALPASLMVLFFIMAYGGLSIFIAMYASHTGVGSGSMFYFVMAIGNSIMRIAGGRFIDKRGEQPVILFASSFTVVALLLIALVPNSFVFLLAALIYGLGQGAMLPTVQALAVRRQGVEKRGAANSTYMSAFDIGIALGNVTAGIIVKIFGYQTMFLFMIVPILCSVVAYFLFGKKYFAEKG